MLRDKLATATLTIPSGSSVLLPAKPNNLVPTTPAGCSAELIDADDGNGRLLACTLYGPPRDDPSEPVYVHAKIGIVDDRWLTIGSANLNEHSLFNDTEMNIVTHDPELATQTRLAPLGRAPRTPARPATRPTPPKPSTVYWKPISAEQLARRNAGPATHPPPRRLPDVKTIGTSARSPQPYLVKRLVS